MIYRIAIYRYENGERKFDHYATDEEMKYLRVNADGKVEMADVDPYTTHVFYGWLDVSSTHEVEIGFVFEDKKYYHNDILKVWEYKCDDESELNKSFNVQIEYSQEYDCLVINNSQLEFDTMLANYAIEWYQNVDSFDGVEVIGTVHEGEE